MAVPMITHRDLVAFAADRVNLKRSEVDDQHVLGLLGMSIPNAAGVVLIGVLPEHQLAYGVRDTAKSHSRCLK